MTAPTQRELFTGLLRELRAAGPIGRLRLLGRGVGALRRLSPWDRKMLMRMAGFEGAESLIERLATEDQATAERLSRVLGDLERDPDRLQETVRALADPERRSGAIDSLIESLDESPEPAGVEASPPPSPPSPPPRPVRPAPSPVAEATPSAPKPGPEPVAEVTEMAEVAEPRPEPSPKPEPTPVAAEPGPAAETAPSLEPLKPLEPMKPFEAPKPPEPPAVPSLSLSASPLGVRPARSVMTSLLDLRRRLAAGDKLPAGEVRRLLDEEIKPSWARRRAVTAWIEESRGWDAEAALALIEELPSATDRTWCLGVLAASRPWPRTAWRKIVAAAPTEAARRRIERRRG